MLVTDGDGKIAGVVAEVGVVNEVFNEATVGREVAVVVDNVKCSGVGFDEVAGIGNPFSLAFHALRTLSICCNNSSFVIPCSMLRTIFRTTFSSFAVSLSPRKRTNLIII